MRKLTLCILLAFAVGPGAWGAEARPTSDDPELDRQVQHIANELRCLVCQNQTIADSHAELAVDLRNQVREQLKQGRSREQIVDYMVERYGDFVLYRPPVKVQTLLLWAGPFLLMVGGLYALLRQLRRRRTVDEGIAQAKVEEAARLLRGDGDQP